MKPGTIRLATLRGLYTLTFVPAVCQVDVTSAVTGLHLGTVTADCIHDYGALPDDVCDTAQRFVRLVAQCWDPRTGEAGLASLWATLGD